MGSRETAFGSMIFSSLVVAMASSGRRLYSLLCRRAETVRREPGAVAIGAVVGASFFSVFALASCIFPYAFYPLGLRQLGWSIWILWGPETFFCASGGGGRLLARGVSIGSVGYLLFSWFFCVVKLRGYAS